MENNIREGQVLYKETYGRYITTRIETVTVSKIGRKYFYLLEDDSHPINKETLKYEDKNYSQHDFQLYRTEKEILDRREKSELFESLRKAFDWSSKSTNYTLEQLREVFKILNL